MINSLNLFLLKVSKTIPDLQWLNQGQHSEENSQSTASGQKTLWKIQSRFRSECSWLQGLGASEEAQQTSEQK